MFKVPLSSRLKTIHLSSECIITQSPPIVNSIGFVASRAWVVVTFSFILVIISKMIKYEYVQLVHRRRNFPEKESQRV